MEEGLIKMSRIDPILIQETIKTIKMFNRSILSKDEANTVFNKENKLAQLEMSIKEREKEINVHKDILVAQHKSAEEERHKCAMELSQKLTRAKNLKLKYESLISKTKRGDEEGEEKYSQVLNKN